MRNIIIPAVLCLMTLHCQAQDGSRKNLLALSFGPGHMARQDLVFSPFIHTDLSLMNIGVAYTRAADLFQKVNLRYAGFSSMVSDEYDFSVHGEPATAYPHSFTIVDIDYLIGKRFSETEKSSMIAGGLFSTDIQALNYVYGRVSSFGYYSTFGLGAFGKKELVINDKSDLSLTLQLPILVWLARSPYLVNDDEFIENIRSHSGFKTFISFIGDGRLVSWNRVQTFDLNIRYTYTLRERWRLGAAYMFEFIHASKPRNLLAYRNALDLSLNFSF